VTTEIESHQAAVTLKKPVRIALLGCGTVGGGVLRLLEENGESLAQKVGAPIEVAHVLVRDLSKVRAPQCKAEWLTTDPERVFADKDLDLVVEIMGGEQPAKTYIERAIDAGLTVVTANKFLMASYGPELLGRAAKMGVDLAFEASVGGGIPVIRTLRQALSGDSIESIHGILNGTCNYILTRMRHAGVSFSVALREAQELGYAEADPSLDIEGHDAAQKLIICSMLAFGSDYGASAAPVEGITKIDSTDFAAAERFGFTIKHLAVARDLGGALSLHTHPAFIPKGSVLANIDDVLNCVFIRGRGLGPCVLVAPGAGALPTAVSIVADLADVACSRIEGHNGLSTRAIRFGKRELLPQDELVGRYYLRFDVPDTPGVLAVIAGALGACEVSIEKMVQEEASGTATLLMITHSCKEGSLKKALGSLNGSKSLLGEARFLRIEEF
jgi:homoserine dehydrogenase